MKLYFGHPVNEYGTDKERELLVAIQRHFQEYDIENPNQPHHGEGYQRWKKEKGNGMGYFFEKVLPDMDAGVFLTFEDGMFGAGVFKEARWLHEHSKPIHEISLEGKIQEMTLDESRMLSVEETRARVYGKD